MFIILQLQRKKVKELIIIPTYNEALNISSIIKQLFDNIFKDKEINILVVDDNSPDGTANFVEELQKDYSCLHLLKRKEKDGLGSAYKAGYKWAISNGFEIIIQLDADFQHPVEIIPEMLEKIPEYDVIIGSRYIDGGKWDYCQNKLTLQKLISNAGRFYLSKFLDCPIHDLTGGFNIWKTTVISAINPDTVSSKGYAFQFEMKYRACKKGFKILEYPIKFKKREFGKSKMNFKIIIEALAMVWKLKSANED